jgi:DtxR family Mn-dependent transcriptional regulator
MRSDLHVLGESLEDYLESIMVAQNEVSKVRVTDIAERMQVKKSSVNSAIKKLVAEGYINHEKYGAIELTPSGLELAKQIYQRHESLKMFLTEILGVNEKTAALNACTIEHYLNEETYRRFMFLYDFFKKEDFSDELLERLQDYLSGKSEELKSSRTETTIKHLRIGDSAIIKDYAHDTDPEYKAKLLRMGLIKNTKLKVIRVAPLGDPIEISMNNYHIILRKNEAKCIQVEIIDE